MVPQLTLPAVEKPSRIAVFASGSGSNAERLIEHFTRSTAGDVVLIVYNRKHAGVVERADRLEIERHYEPKGGYDGEDFLHMLERKGIDLIVLAGFLLKVPEALIRAFPDRIINIHPALLPDYGGKGMYGMNVHEAVVAAGERKSGITIHLVNERYDEGRILSQFSCKLEPSDKAEDVQRKVQVLEHEHFGPVVEEYILNHVHRSV